MRIKLILGLVKPGDQVLTSISTIPKFSAQVCHFSNCKFGVQSKLGPQRFVQIGYLNIHRLCVNSFKNNDEKKDDNDEYFNNFNFFDLILIYRFGVDIPPTSDKRGERSLVFVLLCFCFLSSSFSLLLSL